MVASIQDIKMVDFEGTNKEMLKLTFTTQKPLNSNELSKLVVYIVKSNSYVKEQLELKRSHYEGIIAFFNQQIDAYQQKQAEFDGDVFINNNETPSSLFIKKKNYEESLANMDAFVIKQASSVSVLTKPPIYFYVLSGSALAAFLVTLFSVVKKINKISIKSEARNFPGELIFGKSA
jgi:hypothetical protein